MPTAITHEQILIILILDFIGFKKTKIASSLGIQRSTVYNHLADFSVQTDFISSNLDIDSKEAKIYVRLSQFVNAGMEIRSIFHLYQAHPPYFSTVRDLKKAASLLCLSNPSSPLHPVTTKGCRHCKESFTPDCRHRHDQWFCSANECRLASKKYSQQKWVLSRGADYWKINSK